MKPIVSINLCCYNSAKYLRETLQSIVSQTYKSWELVIVNDGSTDSTELIIDEFKDKGCQIIYHYQQNKGLAASRNTAIELSQGALIAFIDHDDIWLPQKLERQVPLFEKNPTLGLLYSNAILLHQATGKEFHQFKHRNQPRGMAFEDLLCHYVFSIPTILIRRKSLIALHQWFDEKLTLIEEADLFIRIAHDWEIEYQNEVLAKWRMHSESLTWKRAHLFSKEWKIVLDKYKSLYPEFIHKYRKGGKRIEAKIAYYDAQEEWKAGNKRKARLMLLPHIMSNPKLLLVYVMTVFAFSKYTNLLRLLGKHV